MESPESPNTSFISKVRSFYTAWQAIVTNSSLETPWWFNDMDFDVDIKVDIGRVCKSVTPTSVYDDYYIYQFNNQAEIDLVNLATKLGERSKWLLGEEKKILELIYGYESISSVNAELYSNYWLELQHLYFHYIHIVKSKAKLFEYSYLLEQVWTFVRLILATNFSNSKSINLRDAYRTLISFPQKNLDDDHTSISFLSVLFFTTNEIRDFYEKRNYNKVSSSGTERT